MASAVVTASWLTANGIPAQVMDQMTLGGFEGLTALWPTVSTRGVEVWVNDPKQIEEARRALAEHEAELARQVAERGERASVEVTCEECGKSSNFPGDQYGTTQTCPHCGAYIDVTDERSDGNDGNGETESS
jgi:hypothetical protein